jgi:hypothetical protein
MSHPVLSRRSFLVGSAAAAGLALAPRFAGAGASKAEPPFKISLAEWSLHRELQSGKLDHLDFPSVARLEFGLDGVEYVNQFFKD